MGVKSTRLRYISTSSAVELSAAVNAFPFKVEIKGGPVYDGKRWYLWFVIPDHVKEFLSTDL